MFTAVLLELVLGMGVDVQCNLSRRNQVQLHV